MVGPEPRERFELCHRVACEPARQLQATDRLTDTQIACELAYTELANVTRARRQRESVRPAMCRCPPVQTRRSCQTDQGRLAKGVVDRASAQLEGSLTERLKAFFADRHLQSTGQAILSRYDPPWTLWFLRRNEIWLQLVP